MKKLLTFVLLALLLAALPRSLQAGDPIGPDDPMALDIDYVLYENAMSVKPSAQWQQATNQLFVDLKAALIRTRNNRLYEAFDVLYLFTAETEQAALLNAAKRDHDATNNGMAFTSRVGFQGDGTADYINTNYNPTDDGVQYTLDNALIGVYSWLESGSPGYDIGGAVSSLPAVGMYMDVYNPSTTRVGLATNGTLATALVAYGSEVGLFMGQRSAATDLDSRVYRNGSSVASPTSMNSALPNVEFFIGAINGGGSAEGFTSRQYGFAFIGRSFTADEHAAVYEAWVKYLDAISTVEPPTYPIYLPIVGTNAIVQIFDRTGVPIGEILPEIDYASWRRNDIGQTVFSIAKSDPKANDEYLKAQNRVLITFDNGLPAWGGVMQPEFAIDHNRITVRALTGESLLIRRITDRGRYFNQETVGGIAAALISEADAVWPLGISLGAVWAGGDRHSPSYHFKDLLTIFRESLFKRLSDADFYAEPLLGANGRLSFRLNVVERRGRDIPGVALHQGLNVVDPTKVSFTGPIVNRWTIVGDGQGWGADRPVAVAENIASIDRYGRLEGAEIHQGVVFQETLQATANNLLSETAWPRVILDITAVDLPPATFEQYGIGDNMAIELPDYGIGSSFVGAATVQARAFYPKNGRLNLVLEATSYA